jgi:uncharacterized protein (TIGR02996 family)
MQVEQAFLDEIIDHPNDDVPRLVYADWLDEQNDRRANYLRLGVQLSALRAKSPGAATVRRKFMDARAGLDPVWLEQLEQPRVLRAIPVPYPSSWISVELGDYRGVGGTYGGFRYETLPALPVDQFNGTISWLGGSARKRSASTSPTRNAHPELKQVVEQAQQLNLPLPTAFLTFFGRQSLLRRIRSCTDCFFNLPARLVPAAGAEGGFLLRFYSDSQGCYHWYLYLVPSGAHCVVGSDKSVGGDRRWEETHGQVGKDNMRKTGWNFSAPSFESFLYRYWIENEIWYALEWDHTPLTPAQKAYVEHYRPTA